MDDLARTHTYDTMQKDVGILAEDVEYDTAVSGSSHRRAGFVRGEVFDLDTEGESRRRWPKSFGMRRRRRASSHTHYKVYKRRWFGLVQLVLLNIVVSWDVS